MTDTLFDPNAYGPGRSERKRSEPDERLVYNDGKTWFLLTQRKGPLSLAHRLDYKMATFMVNGKRRAGAWQPGMAWEGGWRAKCGAMGAAIDVPVGMVRPCPKCEKKGM